jgi:hypothetical protein
MAATRSENLCPASVDPAVGKIPPIHLDIDAAASAMSRFAFGSKGGSGKPQRMAGRRPEAWATVAI